MKYGSRSGGDEIRLPHTIMPLAIYHFSSLSLCRTVFLAVVYAHTLSLYSSLRLVVCACVTCFSPTLRPPSSFDSNKRYSWFITVPLISPRPPPPLPPILRPLPVCTAGQSYGMAGHRWRGGRPKWIFIKSHREHGRGQNDFRYDRVFPRAKCPCLRVYVINVGRACRPRTRRYVAATIRTLGRRYLGRRANTRNNHIHNASVMNPVCFLRPRAIRDVFMG